MPSFVNLGAFVDSGTMIDTLASRIMCTNWKECALIGGAGRGS